MSDDPPSVPYSSARLSESHSHPPLPHSNSHPLTQSVPTIKLNVTIPHAESLYLSFVDLISYPTSDGHFALNPSYFSLLKALKPLRDMFQLPEFFHQFALLQVSLRILRSQSLHSPLFDCDALQVHEDAAQDSEEEHSEESEIGKGKHKSKSKQREKMNLIPLLSACAEFLAQFLPWPHLKSDTASFSDCVDLSHSPAAHPALFTSFSPSQIPDSSLEILSEILDLFSEGLESYHEYDAELIAQMLKIYFQFLFFRNCVRKGKEKERERAGEREREKDGKERGSGVGAGLGLGFSLFTWFEAMGIYKECEDELKRIVESSALKYYRSFFPEPPSAEQRQKDLEEKRANTRISLQDFFTSTVDFFSSSDSPDNSHNPNAETMKRMNQWNEREWIIFSQGLCELISVEMVEFRPAMENLKFFQFSISEVAIESVMRHFNADLVEFEAQREKHQKGIDEIALCVLESLSLVRMRLMKFHAAFTPVGRRLIIRNFPSLNQLAKSSFDRWLWNQGKKLAHWRERLIDYDGWKAIDEETHYSESVNDQFAILSTIVSGFFQHLQIVAVNWAEVLPNLVSILNESIIRYARYLIEVCGDIPSETIPVMNSTAKYKQSGAENASMFSQLKKKIIDKPSSSAAVLVLPNSSKSFASRTLDSFLVKLSCAFAALPKVDELAHQIAGHLKDLESRAAEERDKNQRFGVDFDAWKAWEIEIPKESPPTEFSTSVFAPAIRELDEETIPRMMEFVSNYVIWVSLRDYFLGQLYFPSVSHGLRLRGSEMNNQFDTIMQQCYRSIESELFPALVNSILARFLSAWRYTILFARRQIEPEDVESVLRDDFECIREMFEPHCDGSLLKLKLQPLELLLAFMRRSTDQLMEFATSAGGVELDRDSIVRIIGLRSGSKAGKFIKKEREKQKAQEKEDQKVAKGYAELNRRLTAH